jgi:hypothetical protein
MTQRSDESLSTRDLASPATDERTGETTDERTGEATDGRTGEPTSAERPEDDRRFQTPEVVSEDRPQARRATAETQTESSEPLLAPELSATFQHRWEEVQTRFVDEPRGAVEDADGLVAGLMQQLADGFAQERERLEAQWGRGEDISTEDLRVALQRYRSFFQRLLST